MRLKALSENISRKDFFDLYSLIYAYQHDKHDEEIKRRLTDQLQYVLTDHVAQIGKLIADRVGPSSIDDPRYQAYEKYGANFKYDSDGKTILGIDTPQSAIIPILKLVKKYGETANSYSYFTSTDGTWAKLLDLYISDFSRIPSSIDGMIKQIDKIYALMHHGGQLTDYFDESEWIEDALNIRANAGIRGILRLSSDNVKELVSSANHGMAEREISNLQKLNTAMHRSWPESEIQTKIVDDTLIITGAVNNYQSAIYDKIAATQFKSPSGPLWDNAKTKRHQFNAIVREIPYTHRTSAPYTSSQFEISINGSDFMPVTIAGNKRHAFRWTAMEIEKMIGAKSK